MKKSAILAVLYLLCASSARSVILLDTGDPTVNTTAPTGALADSGWQHEGVWGSFLGTPIAPNFFVSAAHVGQADGQFIFQGTPYKPVRPFSVPGSDLMVWQVNGTFPSFAPIYSKTDEVSQGLVVIGRGTQRGSEVILGGTSRGWSWGPGDGVWRWGQNDVSQIVPYHGHDLLYSTFDQHVLPSDRPNESHLSSGDSGGAVFLNDNGTWKLAGINFAVDDLYTTPSKDSLFLGAIFDARGYYSSDGNDPPTFTQITDTTPVPTGFYASRIASELAWIGSALADPQVGRNGNLLTFTYTKLVVPPTALTYTIEQSTDLISWSPSATQGDVVSDSGEFQTIKAELNPGMSPRLFARLRVTLP